MITNNMRMSWLYDEEDMIKVIKCDIVKEIKYDMIKVIKYDKV